MQVHWALLFCLAAPRAWAISTKLHAQEPLRVGDRDMRLLHLAPSRILTPVEFETFRFSNLGPIFQSCFGFDMTNVHSDYDVVSKYIHGVFFDGFVLVQEIGDPAAAAVANRKAFATLTLSHRRLQGDNNVIFIYNMCLDPSIQGTGVGRQIMTLALKMLYRRLGLEPSPAKPVMIALSLKNHSPSYLEACRAYIKQGFFAYDYGNVAYKDNSFLLRKIEELKSLSAESPMTTVNRDFDGTSPVPNPSPRYRPIGSDEDTIIGMFRLDTNGSGMVDFNLPPTNFCAEIKSHMERTAKNPPHVPRFHPDQEEEEEEEETMDEDSFRNQFI